MGLDSHFLRRFIRRLLGTFAGPSTAGHALEFQNPVGTVNAPMAQNVWNIALPGAGDVQLSKEARLIPTLVNRGPQINAIKERIERLRAEPAAPPLLILLPGSASDLHDAFVIRFGLSALKAFCLPAEGSAFLGRLSWPTGARDVFAILRTVRDGLGLPTHFKQADLERWFATPPSSICFCHAIDIHDWNIDDGHLIREWVTYFHDHWPLGTPGRQLVAFLSVILPEGPVTGAKRVYEFLDTLRIVSDFDLRILVTCRLEPICRKHIEEWVGEACRLLKDPYLAADLLSVAGILFSNQDARRPLADVYVELISHLRQIRALLSDSDIVSI